MLQELFMPRRKRRMFNPEFKAEAGLPRPRRRAQLSSKGATW